MRILIVGARGMLGQEVVDEARTRGHEARGIDIDEIDITDPMSVAQIPSGGFGPFDAVINCAAYTAVDKAETERQRATEINQLGAGYLAQAAAMANLRLIHLSTDFVFDGRSERPYVETDPTNPLGVYGETKREGEEAVFAAHPSAIVARTAWLFGPRGRNFPATIVRAARMGRELSVVADQVGSPTYAVDLARVLVDLLVREAPGGLYHTAGPDVMNWHELATQAVTEDARARGVEPPSIRPIRTEDWPTPAARPAYSALCTDKMLALGIAPMRPIAAIMPEFLSRLDPTFLT